ncbi:hypothetical protein EU523_01385 [Candidatus Heimdallarchaeota archaeon]|jgi:hypothetical protein|nr:MAG: hypothetical protein EU523_01385 [Candidatus Heimdallarchaeota archaeon]
MTDKGESSQNKLMKTKLQNKAQKMSNSALRKKLLETRIMIEKKENSRVIDKKNSSKPNLRELFILEEVYSEELASRGLLKWALFTED